MVLHKVRGSPDSAGENSIGGVGVANGDGQVLCSRGFSSNFTAPGCETNSANCRGIRAVAGRESGICPAFGNQTAATESEVSGVAKPRGILATVINDHRAATKLERARVAGGGTCIRVLKRDRSAPDLLSEEVTPEPHIHVHRAATHAIETHSLGQNERAGTRAESHAAGFIDTADPGVVASRHIPARHVEILTGNAVFTRLAEEEEGVAAACDGEAHLR